MFVEALAQAEVIVMRPDACQHVKSRETFTSYLYFQNPQRVRLRLPIAKQTCGTLGSTVTSKAIISRFRPLTRTRARKEPSYAIPTPWADQDTTTIIVCGAYKAVVTQTVRER